MATQQTTTNSQFSINWKDLTRGLLIAVITAVLTAVLDGLNKGSLDLDWKSIGVIALTAGVSYLVKNYFTPSEIVIVNPPKEAVKAVKQGDAEVKVQSK
jgi:hypothetical protein